MAFTPGTRLGPYEIVSMVGAGGMGEVYKAIDTRLGRTVAIKTLASSHADRFQQEARAIAALSHPHICVLHDVGPDYLVMEYLEGTPLRGPLPLDDVLRVASEVADALDAAHGKGILHRDLKPANIMMTSSGTKLLDFGLAKMAADPADGATETSVVAREPEWAAVRVSPHGGEQHVGVRVQGEERGPTDAGAARAVRVARRRNAAVSGAGAGGARRK